ncbi:MAG: hypothetical protein IH624_04910 [Phycisphaerae bacterium]|nr:hypothetical protein [Phycisphaerae bacterium]
MANSVMTIPFYAAKDGGPLVGGAAEMAFESLLTLAGVDRSASAPAISEIGGGWYAFNVTYGTAPFEAGDLVGVIDADKDGTNGLADAERYIPVEVRLDFYAFRRLTEKTVEIDGMGCLESDMANNVKAQAAKLAADGWDALAIAEPAGSPNGWTVGQKLIWLVMRFLNETSLDAFDGIRVRKSDGTVATRQVVTEANGIKTVARAQ